MADFVEVVRQATRMCEYYICGSDLSCEQCPLSRKNVRCGYTLYLDIGNIDDEEAAEIEQVIMAWAAEHPAPRYPTWREWYTTTFPDVDTARFFICPGHYGDGDRNACSNYHCGECVNRPIPADIAAKLGIKPITPDETVRDRFNCDGCQHRGKPTLEKPCVQCRRSEAPGSARWAEMPDLWEE
mgnify:CR=1 FL=1